MSRLTYAETDILFQHARGRPTPRLAPWRRENAALHGRGPTEAGLLLRRLQRGDKLSLPHARPMPTLGPRCGELRIPDADATWRILYRLDADAVIIVAVFAKKTQATPNAILETCATRLALYDLHARGGK